MAHYIYDGRIHILDDNVTSWDVLNKIADSGCQEDAFYICDVGEIILKYQSMIKKMPRITPFYAVKTNTHPIILKTLATLGLNFDCASLGEVETIYNLGISTDRIIFANTIKQARHIREALEKGVNLMTVDNISELRKLKEVAPDVRLLLRIKCDNPRAVYQLGKKFGCSLEEVDNILKIAKELKSNLVGVAFHIGSASDNIELYKIAIENARRVFDKASSVGFNFNILDVGGGFPGEKNTTIDQIASIVNESLEKYFCDHSIKIISEPGRYFVTSSMILATNVVNAKPVFSQDSGCETQKRYMYYLNDGIYNSLVGALYEDVFVYPLKVHDGPVYPTTLWGPTCCCTDKITEKHPLPKLDVGDWIIFDNMGAYTTCLTTTFNGFHLPSIHFVLNKNHLEILQKSLYFIEGDFTAGNIPENIRSGVDINGKKSGLYKNKLDE